MWITFVGCVLVGVEGEKQLSFALVQTIRKLKTDDPLKLIFDGFDTRLQYLCSFYDGETPSAATFSNHKSKISAILQVLLLLHTFQSRLCPRKFALSWRLASFSQLDTFPCSQQAQEFLLPL